MRVTDARARNRDWAESKAPAELDLVDSAEVSLAGFEPIKNLPRGNTSSSLALREWGLEVTVK